MKERKIIVRWIAIALMILLIIWGGYVTVICFITRNVRISNNITSITYDPLTDQGNISKGENFEMLVNYISIIDSKFVLLRIGGKASKSYIISNKSSWDNSNYEMTMEVEYEVIYTISYNNIKISSNKDTGLVSMEYDEKDIELLSLEINSQNLIFDEASQKWIDNKYYYYNANSFAEKVSRSVISKWLFSDAERIALYNKTCDDIKERFNTNTYMETCKENSDIFLAKLAYGFGIENLRINGFMVDFSEIETKKTQVEKKMNNLLFSTISE